MSKKYKQIIVQYQHKLDEAEQKLQLPILSPNPPTSTGNVNINALPTINPNELSNSNTDPKFNPNCGPNGCTIPKQSNNHIQLDEDGPFINNIENYIPNGDVQMYNQQNDLLNNQGYSQINGYDTVWRGTTYANL
jgi:hypothetical protein